MKRTSQDYLLKDQLRKTQDEALLWRCLEELEHWVAWADGQPIADTTTDLIAELKERLK